MDYRRNQWRDGTNTNRAQATLDLLIKTPHIPAALAFAKQWPQLNMVIDHCTKPNFSEQTFHAWQQAMQEFSALPNFMKLSGLFESADSSLTTDQCQPYINTLLNTFSANRIIWGSNWRINLMGWLPTMVRYL